MQVSLWASCQIIERQAHVTSYTEALNMTIVLMITNNINASMITIKIKYKWLWYVNDSMYKAYILYVMQDNHQLSALYNVSSYWC